MSEVVLGSSPTAVTSDIPPVSSKDFLDIQALIVCRFSFKRLRDMAIT